MYKKKSTAASQDTDRSSRRRRTVNSRFTSGLVTEFQSFMHAHMAQANKRTMDSRPCKQSNWVVTAVHVTGSYNRKLTERCDRMLDPGDSEDHTDYTCIPGKKINKTMPVSELWSACSILATGDAFVPIFSTAMCLALDGKSLRDSHSVKEKKRGPVMILFKPNMACKIMQNWSIYLDMQVCVHDMLTMDRLKMKGEWVSE